MKGVILYMGTREITKKQAARFMLLKHGLIGPYRFEGKGGVLEYIRQAGCIQYDPVDVCGKNPELVLQSRVKNFKKEALYDLLYKDRLLIDYLDKNQAIFLTSDWRYFARTRMAHMQSGPSVEQINAVRDEILDIIDKTGPVSSSEIGFNGKVKWYWSETRLARAALESLYYRGDIIIHHRKGTIKYYDLARKHIPERDYAAPDPYPEDMDHIAWHVKRRIGSVGLLWNRGSDAWLLVRGMSAAARENAFDRLISQGQIAGMRVSGLKEPLYYLASDSDLLEHAADSAALKGRCELIAPLDNMMWDRKLINALFDFDYKWEIYTPLAQRQYGCYTLPILYGDRLAGRIETVAERKSHALAIKNLWLENGFKHTSKFQTALERCVSRFAAFNGCAGSITGW